MKCLRLKTLIWSNQGAGQPSVSDRFTDFDEWVKPYPATMPDTILHIEDPCQLTYTSGTESRPKGVIISNQSLMAHYMGCVIDGQYDSDDVNVNALPIYHCAQRDVFMNPIFWLGGTNVLMGPDIGQILKNIADYKATMFFAPPTVWIAILRHPQFKEYDLSSLKKLLLRRVNHARRDPQGNHGATTGNPDLQLLRSNRAGTVPHHPEGKRRYCKAGVCRHGRPEYGNPTGRRCRRGH